MATLREQVGALIRHHRDRKGFTQADLAEMVGLAAETVSRIERGSLAPGFDTLGDFAKALEVEVRDFFEIGGFSVAEGRDDPLAALVVKLAFFDAADVLWADEILTLALSRKAKR
jgi:transcriptional regulator with XRE-family HTH domain